MFEFDSKMKGVVALAPMEHITDISYRILCREMGADLVYTEFVNAEGLVRSCKRGQKKMQFLEAERPIGIQIYGDKIDSMVLAAQQAEEMNPDFIDINAGCWVKKIANRGAGAGLLLNPQKMERMVRDVVRATSLPVTVKTRLGWDKEHIVIEEVAQRIENAGAKALTLHCRTRCDGHSGEPDWSWIAKLKEHISIPILLNGGILTAKDALLAFKTTPSNGVMVARGAIGNPWVFREAKETLKHGEVRTPTTPKERHRLCLRHLTLFLELKGSERIGIPAFRRYYSGYLRGLEGAGKARRDLMQLNTFDEVKARLEEFFLPDAKPMVT